MIRAALFDLDGVIRHFDVSGLDAIEQRHGLTPRTILSALLQTARMEAAVTGRLTDEAWRAAAALDMGPAGRDFLAWEGMTGHVDERVFDHLRQVRTKVPVGLLTNATSRLPSDLRKLGLHGTFDRVVNTSEIGVAKPDARAFHHAAEALGFAPVEIAFIDDTPRNVEAAASLGFAVHLFKGVEGLTAFLATHGLL